MQKAPDAFRTISEVAEDLDLPQHVLRFWETRFSQIKPMKRGGGRRYYRPEDINLLRGIRHLLYGEGYTIKGVQRILKEQGVRFVADGAVGDSSETEEKSVSDVQAEPAKVVEETHRKVKDALTPSTQPVVNEPKPDIANLAASYDTPEGLAASSRVVKNADAKISDSASAPFALTHNVPAHLVDAITSGSSMIETVELAESEPAAKTEEALPADILPETDEPDSSKPRGRNLLERFKPGGAQGEDKKAGEEFILLSNDAQRLQETLVDLLECKRLLDQIR